MIRKDLPENPQERKVIMLLSATDIMHLHSNKMEWIKSPNITVLEYPFDNDSPILKTKLYKDLENANLINPGAILSQSPYNLDVYADATKIEDLIVFNAKDKYYLISGFCRRLGATIVHCEHIESVWDTTNIENGGKIGGIAGNAPAGASIQLKKDLESKLEQEFVLDDIYLDPETNIEEAKKYLDDNRIFNSKDFTSLLDARTGKGKIVKRSISFSLASETKQSLKILAGIKYGPFNADGNYTKECNKRKDIKVIIKVEFGNG